MLATLNDVLPQENENYVVPAFNIFCYEDAKACIEAAEELWIPIILATNSVTIEHMPLPVLSSMLISMAEESSVPVVIHLDHAKDFQTIAKALKYGYSSIMFDGSQLSLKENIKQTKEIVKMSHAFGASVEAEIGTVAYRDKFKHIQQVYTDPKEAAVFAQETKSRYISCFSRFFASYGGSTSKFNF